MERILIRAGVAPWAEYNALDVITDKIIGQQHRESAVCQQHHPAGGHCGQPGGLYL